MTMLQRMHQAQVLERHEAICDCCGNIYDRTHEPIEAQESGIYMCEDCWYDKAY